MISGSCFVKCGHFLSVYSCERERMSERERGGKREGEKDDIVGGSKKER